MLVEQTDHESAVAFMRLDGVLDCLIPTGRSVVDLIGARERYGSNGYRRRRQLPRLRGQRRRPRRGPRSLGQREDLAAGSLQRGRVPARPSRTWPRSSCRGWHRRWPRSSSSGTSEHSRSSMPSRRATDDYASEFLCLKMSVAVVDDMKAAIDHIARFGSGHSEAIVTRDLLAAETFDKERRCCCSARERVHPLRGRGRARSRSGDRDLHAKAPCTRPDGTRGLDLRQIRDLR